MWTKCNKVVDKCPQTMYIVGGFNPTTQNIERRKAE